MQRKTEWADRKVKVLQMSVTSASKRAMKTFLYKLFGFGKIPESLLSELKNERIVASDEGVRASITYLNFRAPGRYSKWRRQWFIASIILTEKRLVLLKFSKPFVDVSLTDERINKLEILCEADDSLLIAFEAGLFLENSSGRIECRFRTPQARIFADAIYKKVK